MDPQPTQPSTPIQSVQPSITPISSNTPSTENKPSWMLWVLIVLVIVFASTTGYLLLGSKATQQPVVTSTVAISPSPTPPPAGGPTASWQTYSDPSLNISFKYPQGWYAGKQSVGTTVGTTTAIYVNEVPIPSIPLIHGLPNGLQISISNHSQSQEIPNPVWNHQNSDITIGGIKGTQVIDQEPNKSDGIMRTTIVLNNGEHDYVILFSNTDSNGSHNKIFDQILSTFKFL